MKANASYTPTNMAVTAERYTGKKPTSAAKPAWPTYDRQLKR